MCIFLNYGFSLTISGASLGVSDKESTCQCRRCKFGPWVRKIPWRRKWQPTPIFLTGKSHGQRSLVHYSPWSHKRVGHNLVTTTITTKVLTTASFLFIPLFISKDNLQPLEQHTHTHTHMYVCILYISTVFHEHSIFSQLTVSN